MNIKVLKCLLVYYQEIEQLDYLMTFGINLDRLDKEKKKYKKLDITIK